MDDPSLRDLLARNQEGMAGAAGLSLVFGVCYAVYKQLDFRKSVLAGATGALFAAVIWLFVTEQWRLPVIFCIPVAIVCGFGAFPVVRAYVQKDDQLADGALGGFVGIVRGLLKRIVGGGA